MTRRTKYKRYSGAVKAAISITGNLNLFPDLNIPKTTAAYWTKRGFHIDDPIEPALVSAIGALTSERNELRKELQETEALTKLLRYVFTLMGFNLHWKKLTEMETKAKIVDAIELTTQKVSRQRCLAELGISLSRYKNWRREKNRNSHLCPRRNAMQLTFDEVQTMRRLVTSREFAHFPVRSLHYYAKREELLHCSYSTWIKYLKQFGWKRHRKHFPERKHHTGVRAKHPNEIWHLDVSIWVMANSTRYFIQPVIDNYSRYVVAWQVLKYYDGAHTGQLLKKALARILGTAPRRGELRLMVDGGGENRGKGVETLAGLGLFKKVVAQFEIHSSNSMVEVLFRSLKNNYLYHQRIESFRSLKKHVDFWFNEHNLRIPHSSFGGETPFERYSNTWSWKDEVRIILNHEEAVRLRIRENQKIVCEQCESKDG